jgi:glycosyltransferase involved in cell wall biosynthesis
MDDSKSSISTEGASSFDPAARGGRSVALIPWGDWIEDYLDGIGLNINDFCERVEGGWLFGYVAALQSAGLSPVLVAVSREVRSPIRRVHQPTGAPVWFLPSPRRYRVLRRTVTNPYAISRSAATSGLSRLKRIVGAATRHLLPYLAWPARQFAHVLDAEDCDLILTQEYESPRFDILVRQGRNRGIPVFASFQGGNWHTSVLEPLFRKHSIRHSQGLIIASQLEIDRVKRTYGISHDRIHEVFNPLAIDEWQMPDRAAARDRLQIPSSSRVAAWHGRISFHPKGIDVLLDAWALLRSSHPDADDRLLMVGTGDDAERLHSEIRSRGLRGVQWRDEFVMDKSEIRQVLAAADVYVFPSRHEGFPVALVEAMASGLPVVATDAPGVREIIGSEDGHQVGRLIPVGDSRGLAEALLAMFGNLGSGRAMGLAARSRAETVFSIDAVGQQLRDALGRPGRET